MEYHPPYPLTENATHFSQQPYLCHWVALSTCELFRSFYLTHSIKWSGHVRLFPILIKEVDNGLYDTLANEISLCGYDKLCMHI